MRRLYYKLDVDHNIVDCEDVREWAEWFEHNRTERIVRQDEIGDVLVSTVFLGIDHAFGHSDRPVLFETMIFGGAQNGYQNRYETWEQAVAGHNLAIAIVNATKT